MAILNTAELDPAHNKAHRTLVPDILSIPVYGVLTMVSIAIALFFCFWTQTDHPSSSAVTVIIIANTDRHAMGAKSVARLIGTLIGCLAMNTIFAPFSQAPWIFLITFAMWMGLCVFVSSIAPSPSFSYAATLSAITVGVISIEQTNAGYIFRDSVDRFVVVSTGIISVWIVFGLIPLILNNLFPHRPGQIKPTTPKSAPSKPIAWPTALRKGLSTMFAVLVGCTFWMTTTWQDGSAMLLVYGIFTANLIATEKIVSFTIIAVIALLVAIVTAFICLFFVLPYVNGFPMLMIVLAIFLTPGILIKSHPVLGALTSLYMCIVISLISPANLMTFNVTAYVNESLAFVIAIGLAGIVLSLILPASIRLPGQRPNPSLST
jgi:uncharacterized membrane protein YccC